MDVHPPAASFYEPLGRSAGGELFASTGATPGPWHPGAQHGGPPAALLGRAIERIDEGAPRVVGRLTLDLLGPVPVAPVRVTTSVLRPGRTVSLRQAELSDESGRVLARAQAWAFPSDSSGAGAGGVGVPLGHGPGHGSTGDRPASWSGGYLDAVDWRWISGAVTSPGPAVVWMRPLVALVAGEEMSPLQRLLSCVDSASGVSAALDPAEWRFLNTELTVHVLRPMVGEWICLEAETAVGPGSVGLAASAVHDVEGLVARSAQALLVTRA